MSVALDCCALLVVMLWCRRWPHAAPVTIPPAARVHRKDNVLRLWNYLLELLRARRMRLELSIQLQQNFQEMLYILDSMEEHKQRLLSDDYGKHLMGVEDLLSKHALIEVSESGTRDSRSAGTPCES